MEERIRSVFRFFGKNSIAVVLVIAAVLRVGHVVALRPLPLFESLMIDSEMYDQWATKIAAGDWLGGESAFYMDPLYPYLLAVFYRCFGHNLLVVRLLQAVLGVASCGVVAVIGRRVGGKAVGTIAALLMALYEPLIFEGGEIEKTALGVFLFTAALALVMPRSLASKFGAGVCLGLASLARGNLLLMAPLGAIYLLSDSERRQSWSGTLGGIDWWRERFGGRSAGRATAFVFGVLLVLSPVLWRNHHVSGEWILTTSQAGTNFYSGNNPSNWSGAYSPVPFVRASPRYEETDFRVQAEAITGRHLTPAEVSSFWFHEAIKHIRHNPKFAAAVFFRKVTLFWSDFEIPDGWSMYFVEQYSLALRMSFITFGWLLPFAVVGGIAFFRRDQRVRLLVGCVAAYFVSLSAFYVFSRYRIYVVPPLAILAALGLRWMWEQVRGREWRRAVPAALAAGGVCAFSFLGAPVFVGFGSENFVQNYAHLAGLYEDKGDYRSAEALLREGLRRQPGAASILCGFAVLYLKTDDAKRALVYSDRCVEANEYYLNAWFLSGQAHEALGNIEEAKRCYRKQLQLVPGHQFAKMCLDNLMSVHQGTGP